MVRRELVQVTRVVDGVTWYGFKTSGVHDPMDVDLVWQVAATPVPFGYEPFMMYQSFTGTRGGVGKGRWAQCWTCGSDFPESEMTRVNGHWYCNQNKCSEDFQ